MRCAHFSPGVEERVLGSSGSDAVLRCKDYQCGLLEPCLLDSIQNLAHLDIKFLYLTAQRRKVFSRGR